VFRSDFKTLDLAAFATFRVGQQILYQGYILVSVFNGGQSSCVVLTASTKGTDEGGGRRTWMEYCFFRM
jgi:hypothetical protein